MNSRISTLLFGLSFASFVSAQQFKGAATVAYGFLNPKTRLQLELPIKDRASYGLCLHYYFVNWTGPKLEGFYRLYSKKTGNAEGFFVQGKIGLGRLKVADYSDYRNILKHQRWTTFGLGASTGYKFLINDKFVIEQLIGLDFWTPPYYKMKDGSDPDYYDLADGIGWYLTTGFPFDFQLKFGYQF